MTNKIDAHIYLFILQIQELEHYIISSFPAQVTLMVSGGMANDFYANYVKQFNDFTYDQFGAELDKALAYITSQIESLSEEQWAEEITMWGGRTGPRTMFLIDYVFSFLGAYKTQLFLQLKHSGLSELNTMNLWAGIDG